MAAPLADYAKRTLEGMGVEVRLGCPVEQVDAKGVVADGERIASETVIWGAGVAASEAGAWLPAETDKVGRIEVAPDLSVPRHPEIFAIGDTALARDEKGESLPGLAAVAHQQGGARRPADRGAGPRATRSAALRLP